MRLTGYIDKLKSPLLQNVRTKSCGKNVGGRRFEGTMLVLSRSLPSTDLPRILKSALIEIETSLQALSCPDNIVLFWSNCSPVAWSE